MIRKRQCICLEPGDTGLLSLHSYVCEPGSFF